MERVSCRRTNAARKLRRDRRRDWASLASGMTRFCCEEIADCDSVRSEYALVLERMLRLIAILMLAAVTSASALADPCNAPLPKDGDRFLGSGDQFIGWVTYIIDGDSFCVSTTTPATSQSSFEVRLGDFSAPEPGGREAKEALSKLALGQKVECWPDDQDKLNRVVAVCTLCRENIGNLLRAQGVQESGRGIEHQW